MSSETGFVPLDSELFISAVKAQALPQPFQEGWSIVAKRYRVAQHQTKLEMAEAMIHRAQRAGFEAAYLYGGCLVWQQGHDSDERGSVPDPGSSG